MAKRILKWTFIVLGSAFLILQLVRPQKNRSVDPQSNNIATALPLSVEAQDIFRRSCYDCHSNNTAYPWYAEIQPVGWWLRSHIDDGKREINFDEFASYRPRRQFQKLQEIAEQVDEGLMPIPAYLLMHPDARLSADDKSVITGWVVAMRDSMRTWYPADSLQRPRRRE